MDTSTHDISALFAQLGLPNDEPSIQRFIHTHRLSEGTAIAQADFWNPAQASLLKDALQEDSDWCDAADQLACLLSDAHG